MDSRKSLPPKFGSTVASEIRLHIESEGELAVRLAFLPKDRLAWPSCHILVVHPVDAITGIVTKPVQQSGPSVRAGHTYCGPSALAINASAKGAAIASTEKRTIDNCIFEFPEGFSQKA